MKKIWIAIFAFVLLIALTACGGKVNKETGVSSGTEPITEPSTNPVSEPSTGPVTEPVTVWEIRWVLQSGIFKTNVADGTVPVPPEGYDETVVGDAAIYTFKGWKKQLEPATKNAIYEADYTVEKRKFDITLTVDGESKTVTYEYGEVPTVEIPENRVLFWEVIPAGVTENASYVAHTFEKTEKNELLVWALQTLPLAYNPDDPQDNDDDTLNSSASLFYLVYLHRTESDPNPVYKEYIYRHINSLLKGGVEPRFMCGCYWHYTLLTAALAMMKQTPTLWDDLPTATVEKLDLVMKAFAVATAFGSDDDNDYDTGVTLWGNFNKNWNPNFRMSLVPPILYAVSYFGSADAVNNILLSFDYDTYMAKFAEYGFTRAIGGWTHEPFDLPGGGKSTSTEELMMNGGTAYFEHDIERIGQTRGGEAGSGLGVRTTYTYYGYGLDDVSSIINNLLTVNYSGGSVFSEYTSGGKKLCYILDNTTSPVEGKAGMMLEFNSSDAQGKRISTTYCSIDFSLVVSMLLSFDELGMYDITDFPALFDLVYVGNTDLVYKLEHGFMSYANGSGYETYEEERGGYLLFKSLWNEMIEPEYSMEEKTVSEKFEKVNGTADTTVIVPIISQNRLQYDLQGGNVFTKANVRQYTPEEYLIWDFDYLFGGTAADVIFYWRDGTQNKKDIVVRYSSSDCSLTIGSTMKQIPEGWHHMTFITNETDKSGYYTMHFTVLLDGEEFGSTSFTPIAKNLLYRRNSDQTLAMAEGDSFFYIYMVGNTDGYLKIANNTLGIASTKDALPVEIASVEYVLSGGSFVATDTIGTRKQLTGPDATVYPEFTHYGVGVRYFYRISTLSGNTRTVRASLTLPDSKMVTRDGMRFAGWYLDASLETPYSYSALDGNKITLYAKWIPVGGTVQFQGNGATGTVTPVSYAYGDASVSLPTPEKVLSTFNGWYTDPSCTGTAYFETYPLADGMYGTFTLYAGWTSIGGQVVYSGIGDGNLTGDYSKTFLFTDSSLTLPVSVEREGHVFAGWFTDASLQAQYLVSGTQYSIPANTTGDITFYASFTKTGADVKYMAGSATLTGTYNKMIALGVASTIKLPGIELKGYELEGWYEDADFSGTRYVDSYPVSADNATSAGITLYAKLRGTVVFDSSAENFNPGINKKSENITFADGAYRIIKEGKSDALITCENLGALNGIYTFSVTLALSSETATPVPFTFRLHSQQGGPSTTPRRTEDHFFRLDETGKMTVFSGGNAAEIGTISVNPQTVEMTLDYVTTPGTLSISVFVDGVSKGTFSAATGNRSVNDAENEFGAGAPFHTPGTLYWYFDSTGVGDITITSVLFREQ